MNLDIVYLRKITPCMSFIYFRMCERSWTYKENLTWVAGSVTKHDTSVENWYSKLFCICLIVNTNLCLRTSITSPQFHKSVQISTLTLLFFPCSLCWFPSCWLPAFLFLSIITIVTSTITTKCCEMIWLLLGWTHVYRQGFILFTIEELKYKVRLNE